jgi:hypothetical protein
VTTDEPNSGSRRTMRYTNKGALVWVGPREAQSGRGPSCAISAKAATAWLSSDMRAQGLCMRASFTRAETTKRAEVPPLFIQVLRSRILGSSMMLAAFSTMDATAPVGSVGKGGTNPCHSPIQRE